MWGGHAGKSRTKLDKANNYSTRELTPEENELIDKVAEQVKLYAKNNEPISSKSNINKNTGEVIDVF